MSEIPLESSTPDEVPQQVDLTALRARLGIQSLEEKEVNGRIGPEQGELRGQAPDLNNLGRPETQHAAVPPPPAGSSTN